MKHIPTCQQLVSYSFFCETCILAKFARLRFDKSSVHTIHCFQLIHMDLWGPYRVANITGAKYFLTLVDDFSRSTWTHLLQNKEQVSSAIL